LFEEDKFMGKTKRSPATVEQKRVPWQLQTAKARFSELFRRAHDDGPQIVTRQGVEKVVVLPAEDYERLTRQAHQPRSLVQFFAQSPLKGVKLDISLSKESGSRGKV
jgi:antitoxin Phd